ncbi:T9SS type A sorting domain-containing protein [Brumimicrobium oceani]|nr:T9SS type A sorting domain-containing protein [Brumimicrobium oceani]
MKTNKYFTHIRTLLFTIFIGINLSFQANNKIPLDSYFNHLSEANKEWRHHKEIVPKGLVSFESDKDRIQTHLNLVIEHLSKNYSSTFNSDQISNRLFLLNKLQEYADNKVFPINKYHPIRTPYFVDHLGTNCAVGQMIYVSGNEELVAKISKEHNYDYIKDIHTVGVVEWANEYGFTLDELKWIQPAYAPTQTMEQILGGANGRVTKIEKDLNGRLIIAGEFTELDGLPCLNVGYYRNNQLSCYGTGIEGKINDVMHNSQDLYVFGELYHNGQLYPMAMFNGTNWSFMDIPERIGAIATSAFRRGSDHKIKVAISHPSIPENQEIWHYLFDNTWEKQAKVNGVINDITASSYGRVHAGHFDSVTIYNSNATIDTTISVNNVVIHSHHSDTWYGIDGEVSDTVNTVLYVGNTLIFGGTCGYESGDNKVCLSRYYNSILQPLFLNNFGLRDHSINSLAHRMGSEIILGGDFDIEFMMGTFGSNLATYDLVYNSVNPIAILDKPVNTVTFSGYDLYVGGDFQDNMEIPINYLGRMTTNVGLNENKAEINLNVYPNPFNSIINLEGIEDGAKYSILYIDGRIAKSGTVVNQRIIDLDFLPKGSYLLQIESTKGKVVKKIFK